MKNLVNLAFKEALQSKSLVQKIPIMNASCLINILNCSFSAVYTDMNREHFIRKHRLKAVHKYNTNPSFNLDSVLLFF